MLLSNPLLNDYFDIEDCSCSIILTEKEANTCGINYQQYKTSNVPQNFYTDQHHERQIDLVCYPFFHSAKGNIEKDIKQRRNFLVDIHGNFEQKLFILMETKVFGAPCIKLINTAGNCEEEYKYIAIDYTDKIFDCYKRHKTAECNKGSCYRISQIQIKVIYIVLSELNNAIFQNISDLQFLQRHLCWIRTGI